MSQEPPEPSICPVPLTINFATAPPETVSAVVSLNPLAASESDVGGLKASEPVVDVDAVDKYIVTRSSPVVHVVVVPSIILLVFAAWHTPIETSVPEVQEPVVVSDENLILS